MKKYLFSAILLTIIVAIYIASPFISVYNFAKVLQNGNETELQQHVNFKSVRASLKLQLKTFLVKETITEDINPLFATFALAFLDSVLDNMLIYYASPKGLSDLIQNGSNLSNKLQQANKAVKLNDTKQTKPSQADNSNNHAKNANIFQQDIVQSMHFTNIDEFKVKLLPPQQSKSILMIFQRKGFAWQLIDIDISSVLYP